jgi:beta-galactosidase
VRLGVCYYPEQWPEGWWAEDARRMAELGLSLVRIGEFSWSRLEPEPEQFDWGWLDRAIETLAGAGLHVVLGTPTATPPKWLVDRHPEMLAVDAEGRPRRFGSRRHYSFSSEAYLSECRRIVTAMAERYGDHPAVVAWQIDNEYGCHDTTISYSNDAATAFRRWLATRYGDIGRLNTAWGTVFWSQEYRSFDEVDPPHLTVTEAHPEHRLDYARFSSDAVASFNREQANLLRPRSPGRDLLHNFMGFYTEFDHFAVTRDLDAATWDSYPLGFTEQFWFSDVEKARYRRQGHPDIAAFHHDLYRGCGRGRMWVMEQQPGPVNWAAYNPAPLPGMVRAWTWEAFAHGAEVVSYFRWRQAPFGQEQMHAGLQRPDRSDDVAMAEVRRTAGEMAMVGDLAPCAPSPVALVFDYEADWRFGIQPQGRGFSWLRLAFEMYSALRRAGLDVDFVPPDADLSGYKLVVAPSWPRLEVEAVERLAGSGAVVLLGPRSGSRTAEGHIPPDLPPGPLQRLLPIRVTRVETLPRSAPIAVRAGAAVLTAHLWREDLQTDLPPLAVFENGGTAWVAKDRVQYLATWADAEFLDVVVAGLAEQARLPTATMPEGVRTRRRDGVRFAVNYAPEPRPAPAPPGAVFVLGGAEMEPAGISAWREG